MQSRTSVGDGFRVSASSTPSNSSGGSEPDDIESVNDVYIWGENMADGISPSKIDVLIPKLLESNVVLDIHQIASGTHHHAIVTREGDVFTWGEESGGRLGHGIDKSFGQPHLVEFLASKLDFVACGEYHTCAVSKCDDLFTWGDGAYNVGLLGHGTSASHWTPLKIDGPLEGLQVVSVSCGTWHTALATSNGKLFTFGDGAFGVLGHGDKESVLYPKEVKLLSGLKAIKVACGAWHTAAIIEVMFQSGSNASSWKLFTWGDGEKYCLGHGNKEMHLQPTRVSPLIEYNFHQIACGHTMTVALTTSGHVFTMGGTESGQLGNPMSAGKVPTLVQDKLLGEFVEEISCGAHHVAALTSRSQLYTWGKGANGRLGHGDTEDRNSPSLVAALKDRHIKSISCGSNSTSCICIHKWASETDQSVCSSCRLAFGLTRKRHNCYNCGLAYCHACSSKKALKAVLAPSPEKPHRVCDNCYAKLKVLEVADASKFNGKVTPDCSLRGRDRLSQGEASSTRTLLPLITEPVKYIEIKNNKPGTKYGSISFIQASQVPCHLQLKDIAFPSSLSSTQCVFKPATPAGSSPTSSCTSRPSPPRFTGPRFSGNVINSLRRTNNRLNQEVSNLQNQIQNLKQRDSMKDVEIRKLQRKATETGALAAVESSSHREVKEFIGSTINQLKEMTEKLPLEIPESEILRTMYARGEDFLKENSKSETSSLPSMLELKQQNAPEILTEDSDSSKLQENRLEENVNAAGVDLCHDGEKYPDEINGSTLEYNQQSAHDIPTSDSGTSESQEHILEENVNAARVDPCHDGGKYLDEINGSTLEYKQQNAHDVPTSDSGTSELQEHILEENVSAARFDPCHDGGKYLDEINGSTLEYKQQNAHDVPTSDSGTSELQEHILEENVSAARFDPCHDGGKYLDEINGSTLEYKQQNAHDVPTSDSGTSESQEHILEENVNAAGVDPFHDGGKYVNEIKGSTLEYKQQNAQDMPTSDSGTSESQEHRLEENFDAAEDDHFQDGGNFFEETNRSKLGSEQQNEPEVLGSYSGTFEPQEHRLEENFDATRVHQTRTVRFILPESSTSSTSSTEEAVSPQSSEIEGSTLEYKQQNAQDMPTSDSGTSESQEHRLEENVDAAEDDHFQDGGNFFEETNKSKLRSEQQNEPEVLGSYSGTFEPQEHILEENFDATRVHQTRTVRFVLPESSISSTSSTEEAVSPQSSEVKGSTLEYKQQNAQDEPTSDSGTSESQEHRLEENVDAAEDDHFRDGGNFFEETNRSKLGSEQQNEPEVLGSYSGTFEPQEHRLEENFDANRVHQTRTVRFLLPKSSTSSTSSTEEAVSPQSSENGSTSLVSSKSERQQEAQIIEKFESGVYAVLMLRPDGIKIFKRVKFSKRRFTENQAEEWWEQNKRRVLRKYCPLHQKLTIESSNIMPHAKETIELSTC